MNPFPYRVVVRWSEPDAAYVAVVPAVRGAAGDGSSPEEAVREAQESVQRLLEVKTQHGDPIPPPDVEEPEFSGQIRLRMSKSLHRELAAAAENERVSLNQLMIQYLSMGVRGPRPGTVSHRVVYVSGNAQALTSATSIGERPGLGALAFLRRQVASHAEALHTLILLAPVEPSEPPESGALTVRRLTLPQGTEGWLNPS